MDIERLRARYRGATATDYESHRRDSEKWQREQDAVADFVERIAAETDDPLFLDVPVGTGRFFDIYERNSVAAVGVDISEDMLEEAREKLGDGTAGITLERGDILELSDLNIAPDAVICIRFMNWLDTDDVRTALASIADTGPDHVVVGIRVQNSIRHRLGRGVRRLYHRLLRTGDSKTTIHDEGRIQAHYTGCGFAVRDRQLVDEGIFGDKYIYWLVADDR